MKPRLLDGYCCAGGAARGYQLAGFEVVGIDVEPQPRYAGDHFILGDFLQVMDELLLGGYAVDQHGCEWRLGDFTAIHASPPCQGYSVANNIHQRSDHPLLIEPTRDVLKASRLPYVIENVPGAAPFMRDYYTLCGLSFGLNVKRHRLFETALPLLLPSCPKGHPGDWLLVFGHTVLNRGKTVGVAKGGGPVIHRTHQGTDAGRAAMGIDWMNRDELSEAIPPAYTEYIGKRLIEVI